MAAIRTLVCGGRDFCDFERLFKALDQLHEKRGISLVINGGAAGADRLAKRWGASRKVPVQTFMADWSKLGKRAGPARNERMIKEGMPEWVVAFPRANGEFGPGTQNMIGLARAAGVPVWRP